MDEGRNGRIAGSSDLYRFPESPEWGFSDLRKVTTAAGIKVGSEMSEGTFNEVSDTGPLGHLWL